MTEGDPRSNNQQNAWLTSAEIRKNLKVSSCELMHLRVTGKLYFKKLGNSYYHQLQNSSKQTT